MVRVDRRTLGRAMNARGKGNRMKRIAAAIMLTLMLGLQMTAAQAVKQPHGPNRIVGTNHGEVLRGGNGPDAIYGLGGKDIIWGNRGPDKMYGGRGNDRLHGYGSGNAPDVLVGGPGRDTCVGTRNDTFRGCEHKVIRRGLGPR